MLPRDDSAFPIDVGKSADNTADDDWTDGKLVGVASGHILLSE
jgi:hypothetical protein